ncbi:MAG TPA: site-2 protease family protein, partial [Acidimicrobiales bacterium]
HRVTSWDATASVLQDHPNETIHMTVARDGTLVDTTVRLGSRTVDGKQVGVLEAIPQTFHEFATVAGASIEGLMRLFTPSHLRSYGRQVANAQRDAQSQSTATTTPGSTPGTSAPPTTTPATPDSSSSKACAAALAAGTSGSSGGSDTSSLDQQSRLTSIYGIFQLGKGVGQTGGIAALLGIFALINIFIGIFNLLPTLPFDGGHVVIAVYEKFQEWRLHLRTRYLMDVRRLLPLTYGVIMVLGLIFVSSLYLDIVNPISVK